MSAPSQHPVVRRSRHRPARVGSASLIALAGICICVCGAGAAADATVAANVARVIVRFGPEVADPRDAAFLASLAKSARVTRIEAIRPMSGDSYVMLVACDASPERPADGCDTAIARVRATAPVLMIESDSRETIR